MKHLSHLEIELEHITLEIKHQRGHHLRHFVDRYFCYKNGYINKNGIAKWDDIFWKEWVSIEANKTRDKKKVTKEHVVPLKVVTTKLLLLGKKATEEQIVQTLDKHLIFATITKEEDKILRDLGLNSKMPKGFYEEGNLYYNDLFSRYKEANISYTFKQR